MVLLGAIFICYDRVNVRPALQASVSDRIRALIQCQVLSDSALQRVRVPGDLFHLGSLRQFRKPSDLHTRTIAPTHVAHTTAYALVPDRVPLDLNPDR